MVMEKDNIDLYLWQDFISGVVKKAVVDYFQQSESSHTSFAILANDGVGYAVPVDNIVEIIQVATKDISDEIVYQNEKIPTLIFEEIENSENILNHESFCILCKNFHGEKNAIYIGDIWTSFKMFFKTIPNWHKDLS